MAESRRSSESQVKGKILIRRATKEDYIQAVAIGDVYGGWDYLPAKFMSYVRDPNWCVTVIELDGRLVALCSDHLVDGGRTAISGAARVAPSMRGRGLWPLLENSAERHSFLDGVPQIAGGTSNLDVIRHYGKKGYDYVIVTTRKVFKVHIQPMVSSKHIMQKQLHTTTTVMSKLEVFQALNHFDNQWRLFPSRCIAFNWEPYKICPENLEFLYNASCLWLATKDATEKDSNHCMSISVGDTYFIRHGTRYNLEFFGVDVDDLFMHLIQHINSLQNRTITNELFLFLYIPSKMNMKAINEMLSLMKGANVVENLTSYVRIGTLPKHKL